ncbi:hypothetical protein KKH23_10425 [Patescibacteria group bacterium]|uniref:Uncharacterized protein n=1 Tax=viral metagenome TaxID=1070528 RepID=A0A6M3M326_9ZZZZ|nr:hypothetical protein [Patescibacteria group bacterium]
MMGSNCGNCIFAKGKDDGLMHSPGDKPGDAIFCTNVKFLNESGYEVWKAAKYGYGALLYRVEALEGEDATCEAGIPQGAEYEKEDD